MQLRPFVVASCLLVPFIHAWVAFAEPPVGSGLFEKKNLVAWCIVPFDAKKRGPEERAAMLEQLGFSKFAYDYRSEHIPTFDAEIEALKRHGIELTAWWFPTTLNDEAKMTLAVFAKHRVTPQLWVTGGGEATKTAQEQQERIRQEAARIRPIAEAAAKVGCKVALYNHGGWFGEPENQIAVIEELKRPNVGIVYNLHHGHDHLDRFPELLQKMKPYLYTLNLNGMVPQGDRQNQKIVQLGYGTLDLSLLKAIRDSGYRGPIGILGHTQDDAEERLHDNLDGLNWLLPQLDGKAAGAKPKMRTPIPAPPQKTSAVPDTKIPNLAEGKFGKAIDGRAGGAFVVGCDDFRQFPLTVECWTKLTDKGPYNILVANELKSSGSHWELFSMAGSGNFTTYTPGFVPDHCHSDKFLCDGKWHHLAMVLEIDRVRLYVDGQMVANRAHRRNEMPSVAGDLAIGSLVDQQIGNSGLVDEVRISRGARAFASISEKAFTVDDSTIGLWHLDELIDQCQLEDSTRRHHALVGLPSAVSSDGSQRAKIEGHWGEDALGFRWTEQDSRDDRFGQMDTGPFFSGSITGAGGTVYKGIVVRLGDNRSSSICYDTELMRASAGWTGFVKFDPARFGIIVPPRIDGDVIFTTPTLGGWTRTDHFSDFRLHSKYGGIPKHELHYEGMYRHGQRTVLKYSVGTANPSAVNQQPRTMIFESPWVEERNGIKAITRTFLIEPSTTPLSLLVADESSKVGIRSRREGTAEIKTTDHKQILVIPPHQDSVLVKLYVGAGTSDSVAFQELVKQSKEIDDLPALVEPGPRIWGEPLQTTGELSNIRAPYVIDTINLPFENPYHALMFCGGHDFLPDGRAVVCTLHGDVWLVDGIDESLKQITWRRFATGLFQPLGIKVVGKKKTEKASQEPFEIFVVGRDQITRLHDKNGDGEADFYENFNNDAYVSLNGHEYVTSLETDRAGNLYFIKGNCDSETPHDGSLLRVTPDGSRLETVATGFRNSNGIGIGPNDELTVAPQEGEWTPASAVFSVRQGGFYGGMMSHHQNPPPTDFERPLCWFPRLADNSSGGQVWVPSNHWGPLAGQLLLLSYGQCELRILLQERLPGGDAAGHAPATIQRRSPLVTTNGGSTELPLTFASGIHRGRFNPKDGHLYLSGLKGWVTSAVNDGCFQRVRYTGLPADLLVGMKTYRNGVALTFSRPLNRDEAADIDNYQLEAWNYHWSSAYGSPDLRPSAHGQEGRDPIEPNSATLLDDNRTVFLEIPALKPVDQLGISYSLHSSDGAAIENTAYLTLNGIPNDIMPEEKLHRSKADLARNELLAQLIPGVKQSGSTQSLPINQRMVAWHDADVTKVQDRLATGYLRVPHTGEYRFHAGSNKPAQLEINGQALELGENDAAIRLKKGFTKIAVRTRNQPGDTSFRLYWESDRFPREAIPPTSLFQEIDNDPTHENRQLFLEGRKLFSDRKCAACHIDEPNRKSSDAVTEAVAQLRTAPSLTGVGSRLTPHWIAAWLQNPTHVRPDATMPASISPDNTAAISDLVAYLSTLSESNSAVASSPQQTNAELNASVRDGENLFERLGCIACHTFDAVDPNPEWNRVSLHLVKEKYQAGRLETYLLNPHQHSKTSRMPDFKLTEAEVKVLAAYIRNQSKGELGRKDFTSTGNAERGKKLFAELRCDHCHVQAPSDHLVKADIRQPINQLPVKGCFGDEGATPGKSPVFRWSDRERKALQQYVSTRDKREGTDSDHSFEFQLTHLIKSLRCTACHARDATMATWPEVVAEEGSGKIPDTVPHLTWVGEKLQGPWIAKLLKGEVQHKPRPWLIARMPSFPAYADAIARSMADEHGVPFFEPRPDTLDPTAIETGHRLTLRDGGLDCRQCHGIGKDMPKGDKATQLALGINFALTHDRLRPEFAMRHLLDPPRYDVGSRMPRFAPDLKSTAAKKIAGGDARKQFESIKQFLWSIDPNSLD